MTMIDAQSRPNGAVRLNTSAADGTIVERSSDGSTFVTLGTVKEGTFIDSLPAFSWTRLDSAAASFSGTWANASNPVYLGGEAKTTSVDGSTAAFSFIGRRFVVVANTSLGSGTRYAVGKVTVEVDGQIVGYIDYGTSAGQPVNYGQVVFGHEFAVSGNHTVVLTVDSGSASFTLDHLLIDTGEQVDSPYTYRIGDETVTVTTTPDFMAAMVSNWENQLAYQLAQPGQVTPISDYYPMWGAAGFAVAHVATGDVRFYDAMARQFEWALTKVAGDGHVGPTAHPDYDARQCLMSMWLYRVYGEQRFLAEADRAASALLTWPRGSVVGYDSVSYSPVIVGWPPATYYASNFTITQAAALALVYEEPGSSYYHSQTLQGIINAHVAVWLSLIDADGKLRESTSSNKLPDGLYAAFSMMSMAIIQRYYTGYTASLDQLWAAARQWNNDATLPCWHIEPHRYPYALSTSQAEALFYRIASVASSHLLGEYDADEYDTRLDDIFRAALQDPAVAGLDHAGGFDYWTDDMSFNLGVNAALLGAHVAGFDVEAYLSMPFDFDVLLSAPSIYDFDVALETSEPEPPPEPDNGSGSIYQIVCDGQVLHDGRLEDYQVIRPKLALELNKTGRLTFDLPPTHPMYGAVRKFDSVIEVYQDGDLLFSGRALDDSSDFDEVKSIECEGELAYLLDSIQRPTVYQNTSVEDYFTAIVEAHNAQVEEKKQFTVGTVTVTDPNDSLYRFSNYEDTWETVNDKLIDRLGGYIRARHVGSAAHLDYVEVPGAVNTQVIRFGENLLDFVRHVRGADIATAIIPLGVKDQETDQALTIESVNGGLDYVYDADAVALYGWIFKTVEYPDVTLPENLMQRGYSELANQKLLAITLELSAVDLHLLDVDTDRISLGDSIRVLSEPHEIDEWMTVSKMDIDLADPSQTKISLGSKRTSLTDDTTGSIGGIVNVIKTIEADYATGEQLRDVKNDTLALASQITQTAEEIRSEVSREFVSVGTFETYQDSMSSQLAQTAADVTATFSEVRQSVTTVDGKVDANKLELERYIRFDIDGIELGETGSPFITRLNNTELAFFQNGQKVAYINNNKLYITDAEINNKLTIGKPSNGYFDFIPRENGNLSFKFRGTT